MADRNLQRPGLCSRCCWTVVLALNRAKPAPHRASLSLLETPLGAHVGYGALSPGPTPRRHQASPGGAPAEGRLCGFSLAMGRPGPSCPAMTSYSGHNADGSLPHPRRAPRAQNLTCVLPTFLTSSPTHLFQPQQAAFQPPPAAREERHTTLQGLMIANDPFSILILQSSVCQPESAPSVSAMHIKVAQSRTQTGP